MRKLMIVLAASAALAVPRPAKPAAVDGNLARSVRAETLITAGDIPPARRATMLASVEVLSIPEHG